MPVQILPTATTVPVMIVPQVMLPIASAATMPVSMGPAALPLQKIVESLSQAIM